MIATEQEPSTDDQSAVDAAHEQLASEASEPLRDASGKFTPDTHLARFEARVLALSEKKDAVDSAPAAPEDETTSADDASPQELPAAKSGEGPSAEMVQVAKLNGLSEEVIELARDDEQLAKFMAFVAKSRAAELNDADSGYEDSPQQDAPAEGSPLSVILPEDEFPEDDVYRKQTALIVGEVNKMRAEFSKQLNVLFSEYGRQRESAQMQNHLQQEAAFDAAMDSFADDRVGKSDAITQGDKAWQIRNATFVQFQQLSQQLVGLPPERIAALAYERVLGAPPTPKPAPKSATQLAKEQAIVRSSQRRSIAGHAGPSAPEPEMSPLERFEHKLRVKGIITN